MVIKNGSVDYAGAVQYNGYYGFQLKLTLTNDDFLSHATMLYGDFPTDCFNANIIGVTETLVAYIQIVIKTSTFLCWYRRWAWNKIGSGIYRQFSSDINMRVIN